MADDSQVNHNTKTSNSRQVKHISASEAIDLFDEPLFLMHCDTSGVHMQTKVEYVIDEPADAWLAHFWELRTDKRNSQYDKDFYGNQEA